MSNIILSKTATLLIKMGYRKKESEDEIRPCKSLYQYNWFDKVVSFYKHSKWVPFKIR